MDWIVASTFEAFYPRVGDLPGLDELDTRAFVRQLRRESGHLFWLGILGGTAMFQVTPLITVGWPLPALLLPARVRDRHAHNMTMSRIYLVRQSCTLLKMGAAFQWAAEPEVRRAWGLAPYPDDPGTFRPSSEDAP